MTPNDGPARIEPSDSAPRFDPDLDVPRHRRRPVKVPRKYQRIVANPFLALVVALAGTSAFVQLLALDEELPRAVLVGLDGIATTLACVALLQFHCLDCGQTGWLFRWRFHACEPVLERQRSRRSRRFQGLKPTTQTFLWTFLILCAVLVLAIVGTGME